MSGLQVERRGPVLHLVLDRPERRNPLTRELRASLRSELAGVPGDGTRVVLLRARPGEAPAFAAGADLEDIAALDAGQAPAFAEEGQALFRRLEDLPALVLAAVDGPCFGGALDLVLGCDLLAVSERARFAHPGARLGIVTGWGGTRRLPRALGGARAAAAFASGRAWDAAQALETGLAACRLPGTGDAFERAAADWAGEWAERLRAAPVSELRSLKAVLGATRDARPALESAWLRRLAAERDAGTDRPPSG